MLFTKMILLLTYSYLCARAQHEDTLSQLEVDVRAVQEAALDAAESDSIFTGVEDAC